MRRKEREITEKQELCAVLNKCKVCRIALVDDKAPYIVPLNFGYEWGMDMPTMYFHSAKEGKKLDIISKNSNACFEIDCDFLLVEAESACSYSCLFSSVIGKGKISIVQDESEKARALNFIMGCLTETKYNADFSSVALGAVSILKLEISEITGKQKLK